MPDLSPAQKKYLYQRKRGKKYDFCPESCFFWLFFFYGRSLPGKALLISFIFSSPFAIAENFVQMCRDQVSLFPYRSDPMEALVSFFFVVILGIGIA